jgi:tRNA (guanine26-N2/guanine27-N2)-dimethyltransferase
MYAGRIHSTDFIKNVIAEVEEASPEVYGTKDRMRGMLQTALEEYLPSPEEMEAESNEKGEGAKKPKKGLTDAQLAAIDPYPFYFHPAHVSGVVHCASPPEDALRGALLGLGYRVTRSHAKPGSMKTDAPWSVIWHVFREWVRQKAPVTEQNIKPGSVAYRILGLGKKAVEGPKADATDDESGEAKEADSAEAKADEAPAETGKDGKLKEVVFDEQLGRYPDKNQKKYVRYQMNPRENWGPMNRATGK